MTDLKSYIRTIEDFPKLPDLTRELNYLIPILIEILEQQVETNRDSSRARTKNVPYDTDSCDL